MSTRNPILSMTLAAGALLLVSGIGAYAQLQTGGQQTCLNAVNKDGAAVAKTQGAEHVACVKNAGKGKLTGTAQACLTADAKGKVAKATGKTTADATKSCGTAPSFGFTSAASVNTAAQQAELDLVGDVYGIDLDAAIISCATSKAGCACQQKVSKGVETLATVKLATFVSCKKSVLKAGATSSAALVACVNDAGTVGSIQNDGKQKNAKALTKLQSTVTKACDAPSVTSGAFPGACTALTGSALGTCLDRVARCRVCQAINEMDGLFVNCDLFDDGSADVTCLSGTGPTPTPTPTFTPDPTPTHTPGTVLKGSLTATAGRFNYNLMVGLPGANAACNAAFTGTHACTYAELQNAETAGDLIGLKDTANNAVTAFWAIDNAQPPLQQCQDDTPGTGTLLNWEYPTAHTGSRGQKVTLTNATGVLGSLQSSLQCNFSSAWVGCCL